MAILVIQDRDALRAALVSGLVPVELQAAPVVFERDQAGLLLFEPTLEISRGARKALRDAGVGLRRGKLRAGVGLSCWAEALPSEPAPEPKPPLGEILFSSEGDEGFLRISGELLRLGSEDQRLAFFHDERGVRRNLCRVLEPPYYAILRALDRADPLRAFMPVRPGGRVWIELGARHPQAARLEGEPGQLILIPGPSHAPADPHAAPEPWLRIPDGPWLDLHAVSDVSLPAATSWTATQPARRLPVELRLVRAAHRRPADLWVVRERALEQIEELVRTVPDEIIARLRVATVEQPDPLGGASKTMIVLRARRSPKGPPILELDAEAYVPAAQIPELYLPVGLTVDPPLRPSRLRDLLASPGDRTVWLAPQPEQTRRGQAFVRESLPESAFTPLIDWVDYLIGAHAEALTPWIRSAVFELDDYVALDLEWSEGEGPKRPPKPKPEPKPEPRSSWLRDTPAAEFEAPTDDDQPERPALDRAPELEPVELPRTAIEQRLAALETEFCQLAEPLDDPARAPMWAELGNLHAALYQSREAGLCWSRALWERPSGAASLAQRWVDTEAGMLGYPDGADLLGIVDVVPADLDEQMVRALAAGVVRLELDRRAGAAAGPSAAVGAERLAALQRFFAAHGNLLDLRGLWLARSALARLAGDDRLALFQTRDTIMASLRDGVGLARNVPSFVRTHGSGSGGDAGDLGKLGDELVRVRDEYLNTKRTRSTIESTHPEELTHAYVRMVFAWGAARLGRPQLAREELEAATALLGARVAEHRGDPVHLAAYASYRARIDQALEGLAPGAPFSAEPGGPIAAREALTGIDRFKYDRLTQLSRILAPRQDINAFDKWSRKDDEPFAGLALLTQPDALASLFDRMLAGMAAKPPDQRARELAQLFEFLEALPEPLAVGRMQAALDYVSDVALQARPPLLRNALLLAGYYDRPELVDRALAALAASDAELTEQHPAEYAELLTRCAPVLRRSNHEVELAGLLTKLERRVADDPSLAGITARLHLAAGFAALDQPTRVQPAFAAAHALLPELAAVPGDYQALLREIAGALSRSTAGQAIAGARALLERLPSTTDNMSTNSHYCLSVIQLIEAVVLSLASEDLALSDWARRWVEEDEHLLHRRIHRDLSASGA